MTMHETEELVKYQIFQAEYDECDTWCLPCQTWILLPADGEHWARKWWRNCEKCSFWGKQMNIMELFWLVLSHWRNNNNNNKTTTFQELSSSLPQPMITKYKTYHDQELSSSIPQAMITKYTTNQFSSSLLQVNDYLP